MPCHFFVCLEPIVEVKQKKKKSEMWLDFFSSFITDTRNILTIFLLTLTLSVPIPDIENKPSQFFIFTFLCGALKAFIKPFEPPQKCMEIKI